MKRNKISAKWQVYLYLLLFVAILIGMLWLFLVVYLDDIYRNIKEMECKKVYTEVEAVINSEDENWEDSIKEIAAAHNMSISLTSEDYSTQYCVEFNPGSSLRHMPFAMFYEYVELAKENGGNYTVTFVGKNDHGDFYQNQGMDRGVSVIYVSILDSGNENNNLILMVNTMLTPVNTTVETIRIILVIITGILVFLAILVGYLVSKFMAKPIIETNEAAKRLAAGDFSPNFKGGAYREISELSDTLNFAAEELGRSEAFQHELVANVSHDLRTPLTMITGYAEVIRDLPGENTPENVQVIIDESNRLTTLVNDLLDISKLQAGVSQMNPGVYNLTDSIEQVLQRYNKLREQEGYVIEFEKTEDVYVNADEQRIYQVVYNLINNAINYTGEDKKVLVRQIVDKKENKVRIEVSDSGEGIPEEELKNVWERYYKVDKNHKRSIQGSGIGLSIVKNILKNHDADYGVESTVGVGTTFWFTLTLCYDR